MVLERQRYLQNVPREEALSLYLEKLAAMGALTPRQPERIPVDRAVGRVTAAPVFARISSPHYHASAMDGIAVRRESVADRQWLYCSQATYYCVWTTPWGPVRESLTADEVRVPMAISE